jgi:zinc/manganese transport system permease protein
MNESLLFFMAPFAMCLLLVGIHCYLGLHVLARGVIFVDLSLAQVAAFGATVSLLWAPEHRTAASYLVSLGCTLLASALFASARRYEDKVPQEALIGITYAFASAAVILVIDRLSHGAEHLKEALIGQILWVSWSDVGKTAAVYAVVGLIHWIYRKQFLKNSFVHDEKSFFWDFLFYALFGVVITSSTSIAGVLLVFSFLIVPSVMSTLFFDSIGRRLAFGWTFGVVVSVIGMFLSYHFDLPVGAALVVMLTGIQILTIPFLIARGRRPA